MERKKIGIIGVGNCGSQIAFLAEKKYPELFDSIYINTSLSDLSMVSTERDDFKFKIGDRAEIEGSGKNRTKMKEYLKKDIGTILNNGKLQECIISKKYCYIIASAAGGTGSGAAPILMDILSQMFPDTNFIIIAVLPQIGASLMEHGNEIEFLQELYEVLGDDVTYMIYDNDCVADLPTTQALETVNTNVVEDLKVLAGVDNYATPYESIDEADMENIITTPGRLLVTRIYKGLTEKALEDNCLDDMIIKSIKQSCHAETDRNKRVIRWGVITYFTDPVNKLYSASLEKLSQFLGTPIERFNHNAINNGPESANFLHLIASGLSPINDRTNRTTERIDELKDALAKDDTSKYVLGDGTSYDVIAERKRIDKRSRQVSEVNTNDIFKKFMD